jgi:hypothetical protein
MSSRSASGADRGQIVIFTGPSLHPSKAEPLLEATYLPPIRRGDLTRLLAAKPRIVGIIDGEFYQSLAVTPKEVLALLEAGVAVYGAASMGALRAVELHCHGMIGVGTVFRLFRRGVLDADDEVALAYSEETYQALSEPLINTRYALRAAVRRGILIRAEVAEIVSVIKSFYFPERTRQLVLLIARKVAGRERANKLGDFLATEAPDVKNRDARLLLERICRDIDRQALVGTAVVRGMGDRRCGGSTSRSRAKAG